MKLIPASGIAIGFVWVAGQAALWLYYGYFGLTPAQAGWNPTSLLVRSSLGVVLLGVIVIGVAAAVVGGNVLGRAAYREVVDPPDEVPIRTPARVIALAVVAVFIVLASFIGGDSIIQAEIARLNTLQGHTTGGWSAVTAFPGITAQCVELPAQKVKDAGAEIETPALLIGSTSEDLILYEPDDADNNESDGRGRTWFLPRGDTAVELVDDNLCEKGKPASPSWLFTLVPRGSWLVIISMVAYTVWKGPEFLDRFDRTD